MAQLADWMRTAIDAREDATKLAELRKAVTEFAKQYPLPSDRS
jgi:glycine/serine hydroxymethyltransferase